MSRFSAHLVKSKEVTASWDESPFRDIQEAQVDKQNKTIKKVCMFGTRYSKNGYTYQDKAIDTLHKLAEGSKFFINHPSNSESKDRDGVRDIRDWAGVFVNSRKEGDRVFADLKVRPAFWDLVEDVATMKPNGVGCSINSLVKVYKDEEGHEHIVDIDTLRSTDLVASAATTQNLFESKSEKIKVDFIESVIQEEDPTELVSLIFDRITEGVLADELKKREIAKKVNDLNWRASDLIYDIVRNSDIKMDEKKTQISSIMDDLDTEIQKILNGQKSVIDKESKNNNTNNDEEEEMGVKDLTLEQLLKERPDIVDAIKGTLETSDKLKTLEADNKELTDKLKALEDQFKELSEKYESIEKERDGLKLKVDEYETAQKKTEKEAFIKERIKEAKLPDEAVSDVFMADLMGKDEDSIKESIDDRLKIWGKGNKVVKGAGEEFKGNSDEPVSKEQKEAAKDQFKSTVG